MLKKKTKDQQNNLVFLVINFEGGEGTLSNPTTSSEQSDVCWDRMIFNSSSTHLSTSSSYFLNPLLTPKIAILASSSPNNSFYKRECCG